MKAVEVFALPEYKLQVRFEDEVTGIINLKPLVQKGIFTALQNEKLFAEVKFNHSAVFWSDELEIDLLNIYMKLSGKQIEEIFSTPKYASNYLLSRHYYRMYFMDHNPPHFHAVYGNYEALINIQKLEIMGGNLPPRVLGLVIEWAALNQKNLIVNWENGESLLPITPLV